MPSSRTRIAIVGLLVSTLAGVAVAMPAAAVQWANHPQPAVMRVLIGAGYGVMLAPAFLGSCPGGRWIRAWLLVVLPALLVAIWGVADRHPDEAWMGLATPVMWSGALLSAIASTIRRARSTRVLPNDQRCPQCGFDRRASPVGPCPECGTPATTHVGGGRRSWWRPLAGWAIGTAVGLPTCVLATRWLMSLG